MVWEAGRGPVVHEGNIVEREAEGRGRLIDSPPHDYSSCFSANRQQRQLIKANKTRTQDIGKREWHLFNQQL